MTQTVPDFDFRKHYLARLAGTFAAFLLLPTLIWAQLTVTTTPTHVKCFGGANGAATATASGGVGPYTFQWSNGLTGATITNLTAGAYGVTVTASNGQTASSVALINQPNQLGVTAFGQSQICDIVPDGTATAVPFGGVPPYTYLWSNGQTSPQITGLAAGTYTVTVTDANGCTAADDTEIFFWNEGLWIMVSVDLDDQISCFGANDGEVNAMVMSGTAPYTYSWSNGVVFTTTSNMHSITNLGPGTYSVTVTDANGCTHAQSATLTSPPEVQIAVSSTSAQCGNTGSATVTPSGGTPPYLVVWNNGSTNFTITALAPGTYTATVTDANACQKSASVTVSGSPSGNLQLSANILVQASCTVGGSATVNVFNGSGNYSYLWSNGQTSQTATNLGVGSHSVTVVDITSGCVASTTVAMTQISAPTVTATITTQATCTTGATVTANVSGGLAPYTFIWSNGQTTQTATNLGAGSHSVTVTDAGGCVVISTVTVVAPQGPTVAVQVVSNATCTTGGSATAIATGGAGGYVYLWDNGQTTATATGLVAGNHVVTVTDANGCAAVGLVTIGQSSGPSAAAAAIGAATCTSGGTATVTVTGGTTPYTYLWDNGQTTATATNLAPGQHSVTVTDANGCVAVALVNISSPLLPSVLATATSPATCVTGGTATALGSGGTPPYTYLWDNGQTTQNATNLSAGTHTVTLTDAGGCTATATVSISGTASPTAIITASSNATCSQGGSATVVAAGGIVPYTYLWDNGETTATAINLAAGTHTVTVTDAGGCKAIATVTIGLINNGIKIGDFVWYDNDQNGFQHPLETNGVPNMTVMLVRPGPDGIFGTPDDVTVKTTTTNGQGKYELDCVTPGTYILMFSGLPTGFQFSQKDAGNDDCKDSDVKSNGKTDPFTITAGQANNLCFDAGVHQFCDNVSMAGTIAADQTICEGDTPDPLYSVMPAGGGSGGPIEYMWLQLVTVGPSGQQWVGVPNSNSPGLVLGPLYVTTSFMRCARRAGCVNFLESNIVTITVKPAGSPGCPTFLKNFGVTSASKHAVAVHFVTNPEPMPYLYVVQHSTDQQKWADAATIMGKQDAVNPNDYAFMHEQPAAGMNYYRIKRADASNNQAFSQNAALDMQISVAESVAIYPNPVGNSLTIRNMVTYESDVNVQISTTSGTLLYTFDIPAGSIRSADFGMSHLPAGIYVARIRFSKKEVQTVKIVKH